MSCGVPRLIMSATVLHPRSLGVQVIHQYHGCALLRHKLTREVCRRSYFGKHFLIHNHELLVPSIRFFP